MFYTQLKVDEFCNFCPQNDRKTENTLKAGPDFSLVFQLTLNQVGTTGKILFKQQY